MNENRMVNQSYAMKYCDCTYESFKKYFPVAEEFKMIGGVKNCLYSIKNLDRIIPDIIENKRINSMNNNLTNDDFIDFPSVKEPVARNPIKCKEIDAKISELVAEILNYMQRNTDTFEEEHISFLMKAKSLLTDNPCTEPVRKRVSIDDYL